MGKVTGKNLVDYIMKYESEGLPDKDTLELFSYLVKTGQAWQLQGSIYGRPAQQLIEAGYLDRKGKILKRVI